MKIQVHAVETITDEIEAMQQKIAGRAEQVHANRGGSAQPREDWLEAERETIWRPAMEVVQSNGTYVVEAAVAGLEPRQIDVRISPSDLVIEADVHHRHAHTGDAVLCEFSQGPLFRSFHFEHPVDTRRAKAECKNGLLRVTAPVAPARSV